ncbi:cytochrome P450 [Trichoderma chlorosporum]
MLSPHVLSKGFISQVSVLGLVLCLSTVLVNRFFQKPQTHKYPAGPKPWPVIGNLFIFPKIAKDDDETLASLTKKFSGLCMLWLFSQPMLVVNKLADAKELMDKRGAIFSDRPRSNVLVERVWPHMLPLSRLGDEFRLLRKAYIQLLGPQPSQLVRKYQEYESRMLLRDLYNSPGEFRHHTERYSTSVIFSAVYGVRIHRLGHPIMNELFDIINTVTRYFQPGRLLVDYLPILERLPESLQPWLWLADSLRNRESAIHNAFFATLKKQIKAGADSYCFGIDVLKLQEKNGFEDEFTLDILKSIIVVGAETTSSMMQSIFKVLALNPKAQEKAQEELDRVVGTSRLPTWEDSPNLPYVRAFIKECHRYAPLFAIGIPHAATEEVTYNGLIIPKGILLPNNNALSRDPERYDNPDAFEPERFLGDDLDAFTSAKQSDFLKRDHVNYGFGRRLCQGIHLAENSIYMQVSRLLWAFNVATMPGEPPLNLLERDGKRTRQEA